MKSIGFDLIEIARIRKSMRSKRFIERCFGETERALFASRKNPVQTIAANFCAKEAFAKAIGTGFRGFSFKEVAVLRDACGRPFLRLSGRAKELAEARRLQFSVSLTHTAAMAGAVVLAWDGEHVREAP